MKPIILTIDDDPVVRKLVNKAMENLGYKSIEVPSGLDGLNYLEQSQPQLILLDIMMPMLDGVEVLKKIKSHREWRSIPVIMFTAVSEEKKVTETLKLGANDYMLKPFRLRTIQEKVIQILEKKSKGDEVKVNGEALGTVADGGLPKVIMLVTTNSLMQHRFLRLSQGASIRLVHAKGAIEGMRLLASSKPDMIIADENLRVFSGPEFEEKVHQNPEWETIPVIGISNVNNGFSHTISKSADDKQVLVTIGDVWKQQQKESPKQHSIADMEASNYRILIMSDDSNFQTWFSEQLREVYRTKIVDNSTDLIGDTLSWNPDFILLDYDLLGEDVHGILKRCKEAIRGEQIPYYLFSREEHTDLENQKAKKSGFEHLVSYTDEDVGLVETLDEEFGVNLIEETIRDDIVFLIRKPVKNHLAGREVIHRIIANRRDDRKKFIFDITSIDNIAFEEVSYLGQIFNYQTRYGIKVCVLSNSSSIRETFQNFEETVSVKIFDTEEEALAFFRE